MVQKASLLRLKKERHDLQRISSCPEFKEEKAQKDKINFAFLKDIMICHWYLGVGKWIGIYSLHFVKKEKEEK